ncbi:hypothetical protein CYMTET_46686 [Cymbomonas tetramitiformis]|uniref:Uncharacterized protein n=1 Tax=Cymbomonas tetramitiformis TaxID=36881 RepID=A0AAE0BX19_9CHLO|nr:hypothetical protein CYMTET_46686 [Cymbomonas tetramitiformis]
MVRVAAADVTLWLWLLLSSLLLVQPHKLLRSWLLLARLLLGEVAGPWRELTRSLQSHGPQVLFRGLGLRLLTVLPGSSIMMTTYHLVSTLDL